MRRSGVLISLILFAVSSSSMAQEIGTAPTFGDERAVTYHVAQSDIDAGWFSVEQLVRAGAQLFTTRFTRLDGAGRPGSTGSGLPTRRPLVGARAFLRTSGPDANSCAGCHHQPTPGGGGEFVSNVFVGAQEREPVLLSVSQEFSAERGTTEMHGAALIELLAREMTADLHAQLDRAKAEAMATGTTVRRPLLTKGVSFGWLTAYPHGEVGTSEVEGVDRDLVIRPWSQRGVVTSLRTFTVTAFNHHHGLQALERYGVRRTGSRDFDRDGVDDELTEGDVTAVVLFQALLPPPTQITPENDPLRTAAIHRGEAVFSKIGCNDCHRTEMILEVPIYTEPGPYNLEGTLRDSEVPTPFAVDLRELPWANTLERTPEGGLVVQAFTDLKRHRIADPEQPFFANEIVTQGFAPTDEFLTRRLWAVGNTAPYGHRGDVTTLDDVIRLHGGEATGSRLAYEDLPSVDRRSVIEFLKSLQAPSSLPGIESLESLGKHPSILAMRRRWQHYSQGENKAVTQLLARAEAARTRSLLSADRSKIFALRAKHEAIHTTGDTPPMVRVSSIPEISQSLRNRLPAISLHEATDRVLEQIEAIEEAARATSRETAAALRAARFFQPGSTDVPTGRIEPEIMLQRLAAVNDLPEARHRIATLELLVEWCEDMAFRVEQLTQQAAFAATRAEAAAGRVGGTAYVPVER